MKKKRVYCGALYVVNRRLGVNMPIDCLVSTKGKKQIGNRLRRRKHDYKKWKCVSDDDTFYFRIKRLVVKEE